MPSKSTVTAIRGHALTVACTYYLRRCRPDPRCAGGTPLGLAMER